MPDSTQLDQLKNNTSKHLDEFTFSFLALRYLKSSSTIIASFFLGDLKDSAIHHIIFSPLIFRYNRPNYDINRLLYSLSFIFWIEIFQELYMHFSMESFLSS